MCSIYGAFGEIDHRVLDTIAEAARDRGRDGGRREQFGPNIVLGNWRATPTPEVEVAPLQPYDGLVHNGTIANDKELGGVEGEVDSMVLPRCLDRRSLVRFASSLGKVKGSYAIATVRQDGGSVLLACNYKPIYYAALGECIYFSSMARHLDGVMPRGRAPVKLSPYSALDLSTWESASLYQGRDPENKRVVVIASAGLDSTVVASMLVTKGYEVCLLHFLYDCRAEGKEAVAVQKIAGHLNCSHKFMTVPYKHMAGDSPLLDGSRGIAGPVAGAEYAHEWVPARNLVFLSLAVAYAEANGYEAVALGNNLEESGGYPDNEEEFTTLLDSAMPYAVQNGKMMRVLAPVGNLMKHEIVREGLRLGAPLDLTWSCYRGGDQHCKQCGPCFMRAKAFERCGAVDPVMVDAPVEVTT